MIRRLLGTALCLGALAAVPAAHAVSREEVIVRARAYAAHPREMTEANRTADCSSSYVSRFDPGDYVGLPYNWGGFQTLFQFDQYIAMGFGAGSYPPAILDCTAGVDCSGYVSRCWDVSHHTTSSIPNISTEIARADLLPGDALNRAGSHVMLFERVLDSGEPVVYESIGYGVHVNVTGGWSSVDSYTPRRLTGITGTTVGNQAGSPENPIPIAAFPFTDTRDTRQSTTDVFDGCGAAPAERTTGPEYIYQVTITRPGLLTAAVSEDANTDIDVHLFASMSTSDCVARGDTALTAPVGCGTYSVIADTYRSSGGKEYPGTYTLTVDFSPTGEPCESPPPFSVVGGLGEPCAIPGFGGSGVCDASQGAEACIDPTPGVGTGVCSRVCREDADCGAFSGGCCAHLAALYEWYCVPAALCRAAADAGVDAAGPDAAATEGGSSPRFGAVSDGGEVSSSRGALRPGTTGEGGCATGRGSSPPFGALVALLGVAILVRRARCGPRSR